MKFSAVSLILAASLTSAFTPVPVPVAHASKTALAAEADTAPGITDVVKTIVSASSVTKGTPLSVEPFKAPNACLRKIESAFPGSISNRELVSRVYDTLAKYGYGKTSLLASALCCDELSRNLESDFSIVYNDNFHMGGLAGFAFGGITSFGAMASHIPDGGSCVIVFGPHVGVSSDGKAGTVERRGREYGGACCGSAVAAAGYVQGVLRGQPMAEPSDNPTQAQQIFVGNLLLPYARRLEDSDDRMVELPYALYDAQKEHITKIVKAGAGAVPGEGKIAVLGGIQINTPPGSTDYFLPLSFELYNNKGEKLDDLDL